jgi:hypothetical protein
MKNLPKILVLTLVSSVLFLSPASTNTLPDGKVLVERVNALNEGEFTTRKIHMKMIDRQKKERERFTVSLRKYFGEDKKTIIFYKKPSNVKDTAFLTFDYKNEVKDDDQWLYLPAMRKVRRISASDRGDYFLGTDFTYEDIKKEGKIAIEDYTYVTTGEEVVDSINTYVVEATVSDHQTAKELGHSKIIIWIDSEINLIRKSLYFDLKGNELKTVTTSDVRIVDGIWTRHILNAQNHKTGHQTIFTFSDVDYTSPVPDRIFTKQGLMRGF